MIAPRKLAWPAGVLAIFVGTYFLHANGRLARVENAVAETRAAVLKHERDSDIVIVGIDAESLAALNEWPWPRRHHARLLQMLRAAAPKSVFIDIEFGSRSTEEDDALLESALADWQGAPVYLASHFQSRSGADTSLTVTRPLPRFAAHAELASVNLEPGPDGLVRDMRSSWQIEGETLKSIFAHETPLPAGTVVPIDFSIDDGSFGYVSFIDVVSGRVDPAALRGKTVYVGPTAIELGDIVTVPVYRALPGVVVQAFATETVREGLLRRLSPAFYAVGIAFWTLCCAVLFGRRGWRSERRARHRRVRRARERNGAALRSGARRARRRAVRSRARCDVRRGHRALARRADVACGRVCARRQATRRAAAQRRRRVDGRHRLHRRARNDPNGEPGHVADLRLRPRGTVRCEPHGIRPRSRGATSRWVLRRSRARRSSAARRPLPGAGCPSRSP